MFRETILFMINSLKFFVYIIISALCAFVKPPRTYGAAQALSPTREDEQSAVKPAARRSHLPSRGNSVRKRAHALPRHPLARKQNGDAGGIHPHALRSRPSLCLRKRDALAREARAGALFRPLSERDGAGGHLPPRCGIGSGVTADEGIRKTVETLLAVAYGGIGESPRGRGALELDAELAAKPAFQFKTAVTAKKTRGVAEFPNARSSEAK